MYFNYTHIHPHETIVLNTITMLIILFIGSLLAELHIYIVEDLLASDSIVHASLNHQLTLYIPKVAVETAV